MPHNSWSDAVSEIREATGKITRRQQQLATLAGAELPQHLPRIVAAARLQAILAAELDLPSTDPCTVGFRSARTAASASTRMIGCSKASMAY